MRSEGPTPKVIVFRCRTFSAPLITHPYITALSDCPFKWRAFSPRSLELFAEAHQAEAGHRTHDILGV